MEFMTRRITYLMEEQENRSKLLDTRDLDVESIIALEEPQKTKIPNPYVERVLPSDLKKESQQCEVTMLREDRNQNRKRSIELKTTGKKSRKLIKKKVKIEKLQEILGGTLQKEKARELNFAEISKQRHMALCHGEAI
jgi:hypothetical protein